MPARRGNGPGRGGPASGIPAGGAGWGGPAKGASTAPRLQPAGDPLSDMLRAQRHAPDTRAAAEERRRKAMQLYEQVVDDEGQPIMARLAAATHLLDRLDGKPVATQVNIKGDPFAGWSAEQLERAAELLERHPDLAAGLEAEGGPPEGGKPN